MDFLILCFYLAHHLEISTRLNSSILHLSLQLNKSYTWLYLIQLILTQFNLISNQLHSISTYLNLSQSVLAHFNLTQHYLTRFWLKSTRFLLISRFLSDLVQVILALLQQLKQIWTILSSQFNSVRLNFISTPLWLNIFPHDSIQLGLINLDSTQLYF